MGGKSYKKNKSGNVKRRSKNPDMPVDISTGIDHYAMVVKRIGGNRISAKLDSGVEIQAVIPGRFMKKVWFNAGDYIHVRDEGNGFYDIVQKIINQDEQTNAQSSMSKKDNGEQDIFRPDIDDMSDEEIFDDKNQDDSNFDDFGNKITKEESKKLDKLVRKQKEKERDTNRRNNRDDDIFEKPTSIIEEKSSSSTDEDNLTKDIE